MWIIFWWNRLLDSRHMYVLVDYRLVFTHLIFLLVFAESSVRYETKKYHLYTKAQKKTVFNAAHIVSAGF